MTKTVNLVKTRTDREEFVYTAIYKQLDLAGVDHSVLETDPDHWYSNNTIDEKQHAEWKQWFINECRKRFKWPKKISEREFEYFDLNWGLRMRAAK